MNKQFLVGKTYKSKRGKKITISKRTNKTIWFCDNYFSTRIKKDEIGNEYCSPSIGIITQTYYA